MSGGQGHARSGLARRLNPYPAYRPSAIEGLGRIPASWQMCRVDAFLRYDKIEIDPSAVSAELVCHYSIPSVQATGDGALESPSEIQSGKLRIRGDRLLISKLNPRKGGVVIASEQHAITLCSTEFIPLESRGCDLRWAMYLFLSETTRQSLSAAVRSATRSHQRVEVAEIVKMWQPVPSILEQRAIAAFLDRETSRIDALLVAKRRLICALAERKRALISKVVTRGLEAAAPLQDSGVAELGKIPASWEVKRLWHLTPSRRRIMYGIVLPGPDVPDGVPIVKGGDVAAGRLRADALSRTAYDIEAGHTKSRLAAGDLVYAIRGSIGEVAMVPGELAGANLTQDAARVAYTSATDGAWLLFALSSMPVFAQLDAGALGATIRGINIRDLKRVSIPVPPLSEQRAIARALTAETQRIDALVNTIRVAVDGLLELRACLISAAVTGQIDVREQAA